MARRAPSWLAAISILATLQTASSPVAQAGPFPEEVLERPAERSHFLAYTAMAIGVGLIGGSFFLADRGNDTYDEYLAATEPERIQGLYRDTERYDRMASGALMTGELSIAVGLYLRFLRRPAPVRLAIGPTRCTVALRF